MSECKKCQGTINELSAEVSRLSKDLRDTERSELDARRRLEAVRDLAGRYQVRLEELTKDNDVVSIDRKSESA